MLDRTAVCGDVGSFPRALPLGLVVPLCADLIRHINDPEHPLTLEQLNVAQLALVSVRDGGAGTTGAGGASTIDIHFTPTIPHCSSVTLADAPVTTVAALRSTACG